MGSLIAPPEPISESVDLQHLSAAERDAAVAGLHDPWIAEEGPLEVRFERGIQPREPRGIAFDGECTVLWDESQVLVLRREAAEATTTAFCTPVLLWERFEPPKGKGPPSLHRIDYLRDGTLVGSRYVTEEPRKEREDA
jgi:hypothetical protein